MDHSPPTDAKAIEIAESFIELYGPVAELEVSQRIVMFEAEGDAAAVAAWRKVGEAIAGLRARSRRPQ